MLTVPFLVLTLAFSSLPATPVRSAPVHAPQGHELEETLARAREAIGWSRVEAHPGAVRVTGEAVFRGTDAQQTIVFDSSGRTVQWFEGPLTQRSGFDGERAWRIDWMDTPRVLELGDHARLRLSAAVLNGSWTDADELISFEGVRVDGDFLVLDFVHADGRIEGAVRLQGETFLPASIRFGGRTSEQTWHLSDYEDYDGFRFPREVTLEVQGTRQSLKTRDVEFVELEPDFFAASLERPGDTRFEAQENPQLEVRRVPSGHLLVHPTVDGQDLGWFIFDTGAGANCISTHVADRLAEGPFGSIPVQGIGGTVLAQFWRGETLTLGPVTVEAPLFMGLDLAFLEQPFGVEVGGILGFEFIARCAVEFDLATASIGLFDPHTYELPGGQDWAPLAVYGGQPCVRGQFEGHEGVFMIDTGATDTVTMHEPTVRRLRLLEERESGTAMTAGVGGAIPVRTAPLESFVLAGHDLGRTPASYVTEAAGAYGDAYTAGSIGGKLIGRFVLVFDYTHRRIGVLPR